MGTLKVIGSALYQWEIGRKIRIDASVGNRAVEVQFAHPGDKEALSVIPKEENGIIVAEVPNIMLQSADKLIVFLVEMDENCVETTRHSVFHVVNRPKPADYLYTETEILSYRTLEQRIDEIERNGVSDEQIATAVGKYLDEKGIETGATEEEKAQIQQNKTDIEKLAQDKLDADKLPEAVNDALAQAKASGEFNGEPGRSIVYSMAEYTLVGDSFQIARYLVAENGIDVQVGDLILFKHDLHIGVVREVTNSTVSGTLFVSIKGDPGNDYVLTEADKQEIAEIAADMVDVPEGGAGSNIDADWIATKELAGGDELYIPEQTFSGGLWNNLQRMLQPGFVYDVTINGEVYACEARAYSQGAALGNNESLTLNDYPFCILWAGSNATSGMFFKRNDISSPVTLKVTDHAYYVYDKLPEEYLPDCVVKSVNGKAPDENGNVEVEIPEGGTMQPLTFTGAVNATYDGSVPVSVEIPQGVGGSGGGSSGWEKVGEIELEEDVQTVTVNLSKSVSGAILCQMLVKAGANNSGNSELNVYFNNYFLNEAYKVSNGVYKGADVPAYLYREYRDGWHTPIHHGNRYGDTFFTMYQRNDFSANLNINNVAFHCGGSGNLIGTGSKFTIYHKG